LLMLPKHSSYFSHPILISAPQVQNQGPKVTVAESLLWVLRQCMDVFLWASWWAVHSPSQEVLP
jgi:hypothetical protein